MTFSLVRLCLLGALLSGLNMSIAADKAADKAVDPVVKKSDSGICHDSKSTSYERTKKFTEFKTVDECLKSGGKLPK